MTETDVPPEERETAAALEDFHRRRALGEPVRPEDYRERLGPSYPDFVDLIATEASLDRTIEPPPDALPRAFGGYTLVRELGRGGVGIVYEAIDRRLGRTVAIKVLRSTFESSPDALVRFRREASACAHVRHDHIVTIFEAGAIDDTPFYAMDFVPGEPLSAKVAREGPQDPATIARGLAPIASALAALHAEGIVHRDVKPQNIMVRPDGRMVLADFGLARTAETLAITKSGDALGTPLYMSPEQMLGERDKVDARADVYGLGATLYEAVTGKTPFAAADVRGLLTMILSARPKPPSELRPGIPPDCDRIVLKSLEKRPEDRYASATELEQDLVALAENRPVLGRPVPAVVRSLRALRRRWVPIATAAAVVAAFGVWWVRRPATIVVSSWGKAVVTRVFLDGEERGIAPLEVEADPGNRKLRLDSGPEFRPQEIDLALRSGDRTFHDPILLPLDPDDIATLAKIGKALSLSPKGPTLPAATRAVPEPPARVELVYPRGNVRVSDLDEVCLLLGDSAEEATIEFRRGDEVLGSVPLRSDSVREHVAVPEAVRSALRVGDALVWSVRWTPTAKPVSAQIRVVGVDMDGEFGEIGRAFGQGAAGRRLTSAFRAEALAARGLATAAFREAYRATRADRDDDLAWGVVIRTLEAWGQKESSFYVDLVGWLRDPKPRAAAGAPRLER